MIDEVSQQPASSALKKSDDLEEALAVLAVRPRDVKGWEELYCRLWPWVMAMTYRGLHGQRALAEDASQEVFMKLLRYARFTSEQSAAQFRSFVRIVTTGVLADYVRAQTRQQGPAPRADPESMDSIPDQHPSAEHDQITRSVFDDLMARLDPRDRSVAQLSLKMGATPREVAAATGRDVHEIYESIA